MADTPDTTTTKVSRRHSARDEALMRKGMGHLRDAATAFKEAGAPDEDGDGVPDAAEGMGAPNAEKAVNYDEASSHIREAWYRQYPSGPDQPNPYPVTVYDDALIVNDAGALYHVPYRCEAEAVYFAERPFWLAVRQAYLAEDGREIKAAPDTLVYIGEPVKALGDGRIGGYLVRFSGPDDPDLAGDYFTKATDFGPHATSVVYYHHGADTKLRRRVLDPAATLRRDEVGVWIEAQLALRDDYERFIYGQVQAGKMGWSSGTASHLVERRPAGKAMEITAWPLGLDASLTPIPCEPRARAVPLKSLTPTSPLPEGAPAVDAEPTTASQRGAPAIHTTTRSTRMDEEQLKGLLGGLFEQFEQRAAAREQAAQKAIDDRLKAMEESPALKSSGYYSPDGGTADKHAKSFGDWLLAVKRRDTKRLTAVYGSAYDAGGEGASVKDLSEGSGAAGGYLVPVEYEPQLQRIAAEAAIVEPRARRITMGSSTKLVPLLKQTATPGSNDGDSAFFGGLSFVWNAEGADISTDKSDPVYDMVEFIARKLTGLTVSSNELREDAAGLEAELVQLFGEGLAHARDYFYLRGNGVGRPLGVLNAPALHSVTRQASGNAVEIEDVSAMMSRMIPSGMRNAVWVANPLVLADLITLKIGDTPVFQPDAKGPVAGTLLGRPLAFSEYLPAKGSAGDLILCDFSYYGVATRRGIVIASSEHARVDTDQTTWKVTYRGDGRPLLDSTIKLADGSSTAISPFVALS